MSDRDKALRASLVGAINRLAAVIENGELLAATCHVDLLDAATEEIQRLRAEAAENMAIIRAARRLCELGKSGEYTGIDDNPIFSDEWSALEDAVKAMGDAGSRADADTQVKVRGETKDHVVFPSDYPNESKLHIMRHGDGDYGVAISAGECWPMGEHVTFCASGGRNIDAWQAASALWRALQPREVGGR